ncbi:hypothetical protein G6F61_015243 [Rhizopus arrhizus]|nr:hypothetical protein G6F61_015243 [Rhizopus arrhizus]
MGCRRALCRARSRMQIHRGPSGAVLRPGGHAPRQDARVHRARTVLAGRHPPARHAGRSRHALAELRG